MNEQQLAAREALIMLSVEKTSYQDTDVSIAGRENDRYVIVRSRWAPPRTETSLTRAERVAFLMECIADAKKQGRKLRLCEVGVGENFIRYDARGVQL